MTKNSTKRQQKQGRRVAAAIAALLVAGSTLDRALASEPVPTRGKASASETKGVLAGLAIGAAAGGPVGAILGAAGGAWLGDRHHRQTQQLASATRTLRAQQAENSRLAGEVQVLGTALTALEADSIPLSELSASLHFRTRHTALEPDDAEALRQLGAVLAARTSRPVYVTGYADARGVAGYNFELSTARAEAVADALVEGGMSRAQLRVVGAGAPTASACLEDTDRCAFERRVTVRMTEPQLEDSDALAQVRP